MPNGWWLGNKFFLDVVTSKSVTLQCIVQFDPKILREQAHKIPEIKNSPTLPRNFSPK